VRAHVIVKQAVASRAERSLVSATEEAIVRSMTHVVVQVMIADAVPSNAGSICTPILATNEMIYTSHDTASVC
jgi:hypothetical protein